jgi:hypothetical protein
MNEESVSTLVVASRIRRRGLVIGYDAHLLICDVREKSGECHPWCPACHAENLKKLTEAFQVVEKFQCECGARVDELRCSHTDRSESNMVCAVCGKLYMRETAEVA